MNDGHDKARTLRVLVALGAGSDTTVLEAAARLAAGLEAELVGLCVEDTDLVQAASLPMTRLVHSHTAGAAELDSALMRRALRAWSTQMRRTVQKVAESWRVRWSFQTASGRYEEQIRASFRERDLLALSLTDRHSSRRSEDRHPLAATVHGSVFMVGRLLDRNGPVAVLYQGSVETLQLALAVAEIYGRELVVIALGETDATARDMADAARRFLDAKGRAGHVEWQSDYRGAALVSRLTPYRPDVIVFDRVSKLGPDIEHALRGVDCSVLALA